jgi:hypothetical protein
MVTLIGPLFVTTTENSKWLKVLTRLVAGVMCADNPDDAGFACVCGVAELLDDFLPQPAIKIVAAMITVMVVFFIKCNDA